MLSAEQIETMRKIRSQTADHSSACELPEWIWRWVNGPVLTEAGAEVLRLHEELAEARKLARALLGLTDAEDPRKQTILLHAGPETMNTFKRHGFVPGSGSLKVWLCEQLAERDTLRLALSAERAAHAETLLVLAAEQGRQEGAPSEGWRFTMLEGSRGVWEVLSATAAGYPICLRSVRRLAPDLGWEMWSTGCKPTLFSTARAAMLAANKATS